MCGAFLKRTTGLEPATPSLGSRSRGLADAVSCHCKAHEDRRFGLIGPVRRNGTDARSRPAVCKCLQLGAEERSCTRSSSCSNENSGVWTPMTTSPSFRYACDQARTYGFWRSQLTQVSVQKFTRTT